MKPLILTTEPLPLPGLPTTGAGMRAWSLLHGLRANGFPDAEAAFAADSIRGIAAPDGAAQGVRTFERARLADFLAERRPDAVVLQHWGLAESIPPLDAPLAIDLAGPHLLERRLWGSPDPAKDRRGKLRALARADFATCSGALQRAYFLPFLIEAGFEPQGGLCPVIPFCLSPDLPKPAKDRDPSAFLYAGYFLPWQDPSQALGWTLDALEARGEGKLVVVGGAHPGGDVSGGRYDALLDRLAAHPQVDMREVMPFDDLVEAMRRCGAVVDLVPANPERELAFPSRTMAALWAGLPPIHNDYDELAAPIARARAGWTIAPGDERAFRKAVDKILDKPEEVEKRGDAARKLVRRDYTWDKAVAPLADWLRDPRRREGKASVPVEAAIGAPPRRKRDPRGEVAYSPPLPVASPNRLQQVLSPLAMLLALPVAAVLLVVFGMAELARIITRNR